MSIIDKIYDSEINAKIQWFWDGGFDVCLGDDMNGWKATNTIILNTWKDVEVWLEEKAIEHYPESDFTKGQLKADDL